MKSKLQKRSATTIILMLILVLMTSTALGASQGGKALDALIPPCESIMKNMEAAFSGSYSISEDSMLGKAGTVFIDMDKSEIRMIGEDIHRKYTFKESTSPAFVAMVGIVLYAVDNYSATDYGVNVYTVENKNTRLLDAKEISTLAAQFITAISQ